jgi:hypothetical protein
MAKPGVVLRRPVGSDGSFGEHAGLPTDLGRAGKATKATRKSSGQQAKKPSPRPVDKAAEGKAALEYERERKRRERERAREDATRQMQRARRQQAVDKAQAALDKAEREYASRAAPIQAEMEAIEKRSQAETARWKRRRSGWMRRCGARGARAPRGGEPDLASGQARRAIPHRTFGRDDRGHRPAADRVGRSVGPDHDRGKRRGYDRLRSRKIPSGKSRPPNRRTPPPSPSSRSGRSAAKARKTCLGRAGIDRESPRRPTLHRALACAIPLAAANPSSR